MHKTKILFMFFVVALLSFIMPLSVVYANSPAPPSYFYAYVTNTNSNVKYMDILVKLSKESEYYSDLNSSNVNAYGFNSSTPIVAYNKDGYMSISFHCKDIKTMQSILQEDFGMYKDIQLDNSSNPISTITDSIRIALLDENGNIIKVSNVVSVMPTSNDTFPREVRYDASSATPIVNFTPYYHSHMVGNGILSVSFILAFLFRMAISTTIETLIAIPFKIRPLWKIIVTNIATQIMLFAFILSNTQGYANAVIVGEIFVFISEFVAYIFLFKHISKRKIAVYTAIANTTSLAIGLIFNSFHIFV
nr:hypothetical protein [uncultured Caproiciproducens sp.]